VATSCRIGRRRVVHVAIGLLPHVEEAVYHVAGVAVVGQRRADDREDRVRQSVEACDPRIRLLARRGGFGGIHGAVRQTRRPRRQEEEVVAAEDRRQGVELCQRKRAGVERGSGWRRVLLQLRQRHGLGGRAAGLGPREKRRVWYLAGVGQLVGIDEVRER